MKVKSEKGVVREHRVASGFVLGFVYGFVV